MSINLKPKPKSKRLLATVKPNCVNNSTKIVGLKCNSFSFLSLFMNKLFPLFINWIKCEKSKLSLVTQALSRISPYLCIITPHKNPVLTETMNWRLIYTTKCNKARLFIYTRINF